MARANGESLTQKLILALIVASLSFVGSALGTVLSSRYEFSKWERETSYTARKFILDKRLELLDRTVRILNRRDTASALQLHLESVSEISKVQIEYDLLKKRSSSKSQFQANMEQMLKDKLQVSELNVEFASVLALDALYFGPKTREALETIKKKEVNGKWWEIDTKPFDELFNSMYQELTIGIDAK